MTREAARSQKPSTGGRRCLRGAARLTAPLADRRRGGREEPTNGRARRERSVIAGRTARPGGGGACPTHRWAVVMLGSGSEVARGGDPARDLSVRSNPPRGTAGRGGCGWVEACQTVPPVASATAAARRRQPASAGTTTCMPLSFSTLDRSMARTPTRRLDVRISGCSVSFFVPAPRLEGGDAGAGRGMGGRTGTTTRAVGSA